MGANMDNSKLMEIRGLIVEMANTINEILTSFDEEYGFYRSTEECNEEKKRWLDKFDKIAKEE